MVKISSSENQGDWWDLLSFLSQMHLKESSGFVAYNLGSFEKCQSHPRLEFPLLTRKYKDNMKWDLQIISIQKISILI